MNKARAIIAAGQWKNSERNDSRGTGREISAQVAIKVDHAGRRAVQGVLLALSGNCVATVYCEPQSNIGSWRVRILGKVRCRLNVNGLSGRAAYRPTERNEVRAVERVCHE
jgi:hypothetical protein